MSEERKDPAPKGPGVIPTTVHDPLCLADPETDNSRCHYCVLIAKVREDERTKHQGQSVMLTSDADAAIAAAKADMLAKAITAVQATITSAPTLGQKKAISALQALQDNP